MIYTLYQLDFITAAGTLRLLDSGAEVEQEISPKVSQGAARYPTTAGCSVCYSTPPHSTTPRRPA